MRFGNLSEAIRYYSRKENTVNLVPYGSLSNETNTIQQNTNYLTPENPDSIIYGQTLWGFGKITEISKPIL